MNYLTKEDLLSLVENQAFENLQVEFKTYSFDNGKIGGREKDDLVKEIVAFANSEGGNIIIGIDEDGKRMASKLVDANCTVSDFDGIQLALQQYMLAKIRPRLFGVKMHSIVVNENKIAIVITVPKSYSRPHAVNDGNKDVFYLRHSNGITNMSVDDLRKQFLSSASFKKDIQSLRQDRISMILANEVLGAIQDGAKVLIHIIPLWSLEDGNHIDISEIPNNYISIAGPISGGGYNYNYNADGWYTFSSDYKSKSTSTYAQFFRNGVVEAVDIRMMNFETNTIYRWEETESAIYKAIKRYASILENLDIPKPWYIYITLLNAKGYQSSGHYYDDVIDRDIVHSIESAWSDDDVLLSDVLRPTFDSLANAFGRACSANYDKSGKYIERT